MKKKLTIEIEPDGNGFDITATLGEGNGKASAIAHTETAQGAVECCKAIIEQSLDKQD